MQYIIFSDSTRRNVLTVERRPRKNLYRMTVGGWFAGAFSNTSDTAALEHFRRVMEAEGVNVC